MIILAAAGAIWLASLAAIAILFVLALLTVGRRA